MTDLDQLVPVGPRVTLPSTDTAFDRTATMPVAVRRPPAALPPWRLKRVQSYVETRLGEAVTLNDLALAVGLTPMHFAAQFKVATGLRPHDYLLARRVAQAKLRLLDGQASIASIALAVGFKTQAHFTTVFRRLTGQTPGRWRRHAVPPARG